MEAANAAASDAPERWFFIVGCQRSGTTLLRLVLECHSRIQCYDEAVAYPLLRGQANPPLTREFAGLKVPCLTEQFADDVLWDRFVVPETPNCYHGQKMVFMVRDVRDTIASMRALNRYGRSWLDTNLLPTLRAKQSGSEAFRRRYALAIEQADAAVHRKLARAALYWRYKVEALFDYLTRGFPVLLVRYEDLVSHPALELTRICGFLQVPWEPGLLAHASFPHSDVTDGVAIGGTDPSRGIDTQSVARWRGAFSDEELDSILDIAGAPQALMYSGSRQEQTGR